MGSKVNGRRGKSRPKRSTKARKLNLQKAREAAIRKLGEKRGLNQIEVKDEVKVERELEETSDCLQEEDDELFPAPPPPKKIRLVISNGSGTAKVTRKELPLQSRPAFPSISHCFVCVKPTPNSRRARLTGEDFTGLLEMLEMGEEEVDQLMTRLGRKPEKWIGLCTGCFQAVREGVKIRREMEEELRKRQRLIVESMKRTDLVSFGEKGGGGGDSTGSEEIRLSLERILQFVHVRDYDSLAGSNSNAKFKGRKNKHDLISRMPPPPPPISVSAPSEDYNDDMGDELIFDDPLSPDMDHDPNQLPPMKVPAPVQLRIQPNMVNRLPIRFLIPEPPPPKQLLYCGLCGDNRAYLNQQQLQLHTNQAHRPRSPEMMMEGEEEDCDNDDDCTQEKDINATAINFIVSGGRKEPVPVADLADGYDCPSCPDIKGYPLVRYAQHLAIHQRRPFKCSICFKFLPVDEDVREQHWRDNHPDQLSAEKFLEVAPNPGPIWRCGGAECLILFPTEDARDLHELTCDPFHKSLRLKRVPSKQLSCSVCKQPFRTNDEWRLHRLLHHPDVDSKSCLHCDLSFSDKTVEGGEARNDHKMILHIKDHHRRDMTRINSTGHFHPGPFEECEECGLVFEVKTDYHKHLKDEHNISGKIYSCPFCKKSWPARHSLHKHLTQHHFVEALVCEVCGESFRGDEPLVEHRFRQHDLIPEDTEKYPVLICANEGCQYETVSKQKFGSHIRNTHGEPGKFKCKYCGKGFKNNSHLSEHHLLHENKESKPYQCEICGNSFAVKNYLYIHKRLSHEGRTFPSTNKQRQRKKVPGDEGEGRRNKRVEAVKPDEAGVAVARGKEGGHEKPNQPSSSSSLPSAKEGT